ncbi:hypothetical protein [Mycobacterium sp. E1214]|uniref:hypothetical protein n=1 Tax=Mycobacterium sp. E1214 TaxID=1834123 RepID=UPI000ADA4ECB|nr:hypothetical protein [Mycobacterium sp. E1214]
MTISTRALRGAAASAMGAGAVAGALLFGVAPAAQAAPAPTTGIAVAGPHGGPSIIPDRPGWGGGHGGWGHGGWGRGGWGHGGWGHGGWGRGGWGGGLQHHWWNWWW